MNIFTFLLLLGFIVISQGNAALRDLNNSEKMLVRPKRGLLDYVTLNDLNWLHRILEMVFGDLYTELVDNNRENVIYTPPPPTPKTPFEAALKPWIKNITSPSPYTRQYPHPPQVNLPYPHIFTTPKSRRPTTTELPLSTSSDVVTPLSNVYERLSATFLKSNEKITEMAGFSSPTKAYHFTKAQGNNNASSISSSSRTCDSCQAGKQCTVKLQSFETTDAVFQYAYSHGTPLTDILDSVLRETQAMSVPPPMTWKVTATPETVQLTTSLMNLYKPNRSLVVGVFTGLAVIGIASVTDSRGIVIGLEYPENIQFWERVGMKIAQRAGIMNRIQVRSVESVDKALTKLAAYEPNAFDFIFINEMKKGNSLDDYEHAVRLLRTNGLLVITDALENGAVISGEAGASTNPDIKVVQAMNSRIKNDPRVRASLLPYGGGTWIIVKN